MSWATAVREALKDAVRLGWERIYVPGQNSWDVPSLSGRYREEITCTDKRPGPKDAGQGKSWAPGQMSPDQG